MKNKIIPVTCLVMVSLFSSNLISKAESVKEYENKSSLDSSQISKKNYDVMNSTLENDTELDSSKDKLDKTSDVKNSLKTIISTGKGNISAANKLEQRKYTHSNQEVTGIFLPKGEEIKITVKEENVSNLKVAIGQYGKTKDGVQPYHSFERDEDAEQIIRFDLNSGENIIKREDSGGMVYIENSNDSGISYTVTLEGGNNVPVYKLGETSDEEFIEQMETAKKADEAQVPFFELETDTIFATVQMNNESELDYHTPGFVETRLSKWKQWMEWTLEVYGFNKADQKNTDQRIHISNPDVGSGAASATNENIRFQTSTGAIAKILSDTPEQWGLWHEIGHTFQNPNYLWSGMTEVTVNISANYIRIKEGLGGRDALSKEDISAYLNLPNDEKTFYEPNPSDTELVIRLGMFAQLQRVFGDEFYPQLNHYYRTSSTDELPSESDGQTLDDSKMQVFVKNSSHITNRNLVPYFIQWGFEISEETQKYCEQYQALEKEIWKDIAGTEDEGQYQIDSISDYVIPMVDSSQLEPATITLGSELSKEESQKILEKAYNYPDNDAQINIDKVNYIYKADGSSVEVILKNAMGVRRKINLPIIESKGNGLGLHFGSTETPRYIMTLQPDTKTFETFTDTLGKTGGGNSNLVLFDNEMNVKKEMPVPGRGDRQPIIAGLSGIKYEEGDYLQFTSDTNKLVSMYENGEITVPKTTTKTTEWFKVSEDKVTHLEKTPYHDNGISLNCYGSEERFVFWMNGEELNTYVDSKDTILNSGEGIEFKVSLLDNNQQLKWSKTVDQTQKPSEVKEQLQNISYEEGDIFRIESYSKGKIESYIDGDISLDRPISRKIEQFKLEDGKFIHSDYDGNVLVNYLDESGKEIQPTDSLYGLETEEFSISPKFIEGYSFSYSEDKLSGYYTPKEQIISLIYKKTNDESKLLEIEDYLLGISTAITGTWKGIGGEKLGVEVNGELASVISIKGNEFSYYAKTLVKSINDKINLLLFDSEGKLIDKKTVNVIEQSNHFTSLDKYEIGKSRQVVGEYKGIATKAKLEINGVSTGWNGVKNNYFQSYHPEKIKNESDVVFAIITDYNNKELDRRQVDIEQEDGEIENVELYNINKSTSIKGSTKGGVTKVALEVNGEQFQTIGVSNSNFNYYAKGKVKSIDDVVYMIAYNRFNRELNRVSVEIINK